MEGKSNDILLREIEMHDAMSRIADERHLTKTALKAQAMIIYDYYIELVAQGFTSMQALYIASRWHPLNADDVQD